MWFNVVIRIDYPYLDMSLLAIVKTQERERGEKVTLYRYSLECEGLAYKTNTENDNTCF